MKYLKQISDFKSSETELIKENLNVSKYKTLYNQITKELNVNLYFTATFGTTISMFYPIFAELVNNSNLSYTVSLKDIVLLSVASLAILFKENRHQVNKLTTVIEEKGYTELLKKFGEFLTSSKSLFQAFAKNSGKVVISIVDMFSYTALFVPFYLGLLDIIDAYNIGLDSFTPAITTSGLALSTGIGLLTISVKHLMSLLIKKIGKLTKKKAISESLDLDSIINCLD